MTEFFPPGPAGAAEPGAPIAPALPLTPAPVITYDYTSAPPPHFVPVPQPARRRMPVWGWVLIGAAVLVILMTVTAVVVVLNQHTKGFSPDYRGTPVEATDATESVVVSDSVAVSYKKPDAWVEASDFMDTSSLDAAAQVGTRLVGMHFTTSPDVNVPQLVMVVEETPDRNFYGTMEEAFQGYFKGYASSGAVFTTPDPVPYSTPNGLDGYVANFDATLSAAPTSNRVVIVGHGRRVVMVQWTSFSGAVDEQAMDDFVESLRIDK